MTIPESQLASAVLMIRPVLFESNPLTADSNNFQTELSMPAAEQQERALQEFDGFVTVLRDAGIRAIVENDTASPHTPDSIFPNNWVTLHADGRVVLYPMEAPNRRTERRMDVIEALAARHGYQVREIIDLSHHEENGHFLEGTGSLVLDRVNHIAYACLSSRTHLDPLGDFAQQLDYDVLTFEAADHEGVPIYHTNVMMGVGEEVAVVCDAAIQRPEQRDAVLKRLQESGRDVVSLNHDQLLAFAGNVLELRNAAGERIIVMSEQAYRSLDDGQIGQLENGARLVRAAIDTIETSAGGGVRCMLAEIHLPE